MILLAFILMFAFLVLAFGGLAEAPIALTFGWLSFIGRTFPRIVWNWDLLGMAGLCLVGIAVGFQWFANWLLRQKSSQGASRIWSWRWTVCGIAIGGLLLLSGMAVGGAAHQIGWMSSSDEPVTRPLLRYYADEIRVAGSVLAQVLRKSEPPSMAALRETLNAEEWIPDSVRKRNDQRYAIQAFAVMDADGEIEAVLLRARDPGVQTVTDVYLIGINGTESFRSTEWDALFETHKARLVSL
ncbi:MAG: hypothetical protein HC841_00855 [Verrucomicrobiae bacterium]|nr:hypothetical protein [Verrucomicrobiae bacterium]